MFNILLHLKCPLFRLIQLSGFLLGNQECLQDCEKQMRWPWEIMEDPLSSQKHLWVMRTVDTHKHCFL